MGEHQRKADGRRVFSTEFKRATVERILTGEKTLAELSRELDISRSVIRNWKRFAEAGATTAVQASEDVVLASHLREVYAKIRELERAMGRKTMEVEIRRAAQEVVKNESGHGTGRPTCETRNSRCGYGDRRPGSGGRQLHGANRELVKTHGPGVARALESGDAARRSRLGK